MTSAVAEDRRAERAVALPDGYLESLERLESLPTNRDGSDKSWVHRLSESTRRHFSSARRVP